MSGWLQTSDGTDMTTPHSALHIEADHIVLLEGERAPLLVRVSPRGLMNKHWPRGKPGSVSLERAIDDVEDTIEQAGLLHADRGVLHSTASLVRVLPSRFRASREFSLEDIEGEFSRLVTASGAASVDTGTAATGEAAAALLLLRELMPHLGFGALTAHC